MTINKSLNRVIGLSLVLIFTVAFPGGAQAAKTSVYKQSYTDSKIGVSFSYNLNKPFAVKNVYNSSGKPTIARSFTEGGKEGLYISLIDKQEANLSRFVMELIMLGDGETDEEGSFFEVKKSTIKGGKLKGKFDEYDIKVTDKSGDIIGATILFYPVKDKKGKEIGSVVISNGWGSKLPDSLRQDATYNGEAVSYEPYFSSEKKSALFLKQVLKSIRMDEKTIMKAIENK